MPVHVMAEVDFFTTMNGSLNTSLQENDQYCDRGSLPVRNENINVVADDLDGKLDNGDRDPVGNKSLPTQDGDAPQNMEQTLDSVVTVNVKQTSSEDSLDMPSDLGNNEDSKTQCSSSENLECDRQTLIPPNASSLAQTNNCASETLKVSAEHISTDASQSNKHKSGFPLPLDTSLVNSVTTSPYFTRSAKKSRLSSPVTHAEDTCTSAQSTTCSLVTSGTPSTSFLANSSKAVTTFANSVPESTEPAMTFSVPTSAQDVSQTTVVNSAGTSSTISLSNSSKPVTTFAISLHESNEPAAAIVAPTGASDVSQTPAITSVAVSIPVSQMMTLPTIPAPFSNPIMKQDDPGCTTSIPSHIVTPQMLKQALATCTFPMNTPVNSSTAGNSSTPLAIPSLANKVVDLEPTSGSNNEATISSSTVPSTSNSKALVAIHIPMLKLDPEVPIAPSNVTPNVAQTTVAANPCPDNASSGSTSIVNSSTAPPDIPAIFPDFTPCSKCNSILVCSCPGPSSIGEGSGAVPTTCQAGCQGDCTCNGMKAAQVDGLSPSEQDVKPQIFPVVPMNVLDQLFDSLVEYDKVAKAEQPETITTRLFPYQLQALNWMITRENNTDLAAFWTQVNKNTWFNKGTNCSTDRKPNSPKGGILADDMGLGKTLTVITLIMANHLNGKPMFSRRSSANKRGASTSSQDGECKSEPAEKMPRKNSDNGDNDGDVEMDYKEAVKAITIKKRKDAGDKKKRLADSKALKQPGFKFRQMYLSKFSSKAIKKEKFKEEKEVPKPKKSPLPISIDTDDNIDSATPWLSAGKRSVSANGTNNNKSQSDEEHGATLIVCPLSVLSNWTDQICSHVHPDVSLQVYMYYGAERLRDVKFLRQQDIVLTTYPTLTNDYSRNDSPLHKIKWLRIILDEGHTIRNPQTRLTKAMIDLAAKRRWVLTGTPIQNRLDDLWSVCKFLRLEPFDDKGWWKSALASSVRKGDQQGVNRLQKLLKHISIRRLKTDHDEGKPLVKLPPRTVVIQEVELSDEERKLYDAMQNHGQLIIRGYLQDGTVLAKYAHCFAILMRLRQLCLHPDLCAKECESLQHAQNLLQGLDDSDDDDLDVDHDTNRLIKDLIMTLSSGSDEECSVCLDSLVEPVITRCAHVFCQQCIMDVMTSDNLAPRCPLCRAPLNENELIKVPEKKKQKPEAKKTNEGPEESKKSSKLDALIGALCAIRDKDPSTKSLVVSQFTSFLDVIEKALKKEDLSFVRLDGRMNQEARARAIENFSDPSFSSPRVFLLSLTAGGVGLNLTAATRVFLMDPAWNPAIEEQCFDRSHRLGQTQEVIITKYIVMNSVEERMLSLQEQKRTLMGQAFGLQTQSQEERRRARVRDIKHLIGL